MTRVLILMRHAKSSWDTPGLSDHDRPLNDRGRRSARALGHWLRASGWLPDEVLCSTALRTRETLAGQAHDAPTTFTGELYHAGPDTLARVLAASTGDTVLMIGHNPGIADFADQVLKTPPDHDRFHDYPTGATLVAQFGSAWANGTTLGFTTPRELV